MKTNCKLCDREIFKITNVKYCAECKPKAIKFNQKTARNIEKAIRNRNIEKAKSMIKPLVLKPTSYPKDTLIPLSLVFKKGCRKDTLTALMGRMGFKPTLIDIVKKRVDNKLHTYRTRSFTLGEIEKGIKIKHMQYVKTASLTIKHSRDNLIRDRNIILNWMEE